MLALLFATALSPAAPQTDTSDDLSTPPSPCAIQWAPSSEDYPMFVDLTEPMLLRQCEDISAVLDYEGPPESLVIHISGDHLEFRVLVSITDGEATLFESAPTDVCECGSKELTTLAMQQVVAAVEDLRALNKPTPPASQDIVSPPPPPPPKPKHPYRWAGLGAGVAGLGTLAAGVYLHLDTSSSVVFDQREAPVQEERQRSRGLTLPLLIGGSAMVAAGISFLVYDAVATRKPQDKRVSVLPAAAPSWAGFRVNGKF